ncbi:MAG: hypothetical protein PHT47_05100 [Candidatus Cloacimonetes bacterium]|nr:hypothetical protein [Candidatus Cloacimonadota bacterium]
MTDFQFHMFALPLVYAPIVFGIYASVAYYRKFSIDKVNSWKRASIITNISPNEFIQISQNLCANKGCQLIDITILSKEFIKVIIKESPSPLWWFGQIYYIEYRVVEQPEVIVYARGCVFKESLNVSSYNNTLNSYVKI